MRRTGKTDASPATGTVGTGQTGTAKTGDVGLGAFSVVGAVMVPPGSKEMKLAVDDAERPPAGGEETVLGGERMVGVAAGGRRQRCIARPRPPSAPASPPDSCP